MSGSGDRSVLACGSHSACTIFDTNKPNRNRREGLDTGGFAQAIYAKGKEGLDTDSKNKKDFDKLLDQNESAEWHFRNSSHFRLLEQAPEVAPASSAGT